MRSILKFGKRSIMVACVFGIFMLGSGIPPASGWADAVYEHQTPSWEGTGKIYMDREIAPIMGYQGARWLERSSRNREEASDRLIQLLPLESTDQVADIGAGTGYMTMRISKRIPEGQVFAVDVQPEMVEMLTTRLKDVETRNIHPILGSERSPNLEYQSIDLALMVDVYHELNYPREMLNAIAAALKPEGKIVLAEYKAENPRVMIKPLHKMSQSQVKAELQAAGFTYKNSLRGLPQQHLLVFEKS